MGKAEHRCLRCQGLMIRGAVRVRGSYDAHARIEFVQPGAKTSWNPIEAFKQGISGEPEDQVYDLNGMAAFLCQTCGHLELFAWVDEGERDPAD